MHTTCQYKYLTLLQIKDAKYKQSYIRAPKSIKQVPSHFFSLFQHIGTDLNSLWELLIVTVKQFNIAAASRLSLIREDSATSRSYGPTIGSLIDRHGTCIRTAGSAEAIEQNAANCTCQSMFPDFIDLSVNHVRTSDASILPYELSRFAKLGLNFRPKFSYTVKEILKHIKSWTRSVLKKLRHKAIKENLSLITATFCSRVQKKLVTKDIRGLSLRQLKTLSDRFTKHIVVTCTDKVAQTPSFECIHWYRLVCLRRLQSAAFKPCVFPNMLEIPLVSEFTPWVIESEFKPAILFGMAKQHKRDSDPLAYRWITSACSDKSRPLSDEALRVFTFLWNKAQSDCMLLSSSTGAKYFWAIDSLDIVPLNTDLGRLREQISAFDLEKCFESIPLFDSVHSLENRVSLFLDLV